MRVLIVILIDLLFVLELLSSFHTTLRLNRFKRPSSTTARLASIDGLFPLLSARYFPPSEQIVEENLIAILEQYVQTLMPKKIYPQEDLETLSWAVSALSTKDYRLVLQVSM